MSAFKTMEDYFRIGVVTAPHGVHGEMKVFPTTDDLDRFRQVNPVLLTTPKTREVRKIEGVKYFKGMAILKLSGIDSMNDAEKYRKAEIWVERAQLPKIPGKYLIADLIGMDVVTEDGTPVGVLDDVLQTAANDVFVVKKPDGRELLLPKIPSCILNVDEEGRRITVYVLPGLED